MASPKVIAQRKRRLLAVLLASLVLLGLIFGFAAIYWTLGSWQFNYAADAGLRNAELVEARRMLEYHYDLSPYTTPDNARATVLTGLSSEKVKLTDLGKQFARCLTHETKCVDPPGAGPFGPMPCVVSEEVDFLPGRKPIPKVDVTSAFVGFAQLVSGTWAKAHSDVKFPLSDDVVCRFAEDFAWVPVAEANLHVVPTLEAALGKPELSYMDFVYFSVATISTTGYGDITPATTDTRSLAALEIFLGLVLMGFLLARLTERIDDSTPPGP